MAFQIDLNELPISSPREATNVSVCAICRKEVSGRRTETRTAEQEFRCFSCLLKNGGGAVKAFDINALPDNMAEDNADVRIPAPSSFGPMMEDDNAPSTSAAATGAASFGFHGRRNVSSGRDFGSNSRESSPYMIYLQTLNEYISERSGILGEGWCVEFEFCNKTNKTSAIYIAPNGRRLKSKEEVAHYLGLPGNPPALSRAIITKGPGFPDQGSHDAFPYQLQDFYLLAAGTVDRRSTYLNKDHIWPVGYRSAWHDIITGSLFVSDVVDGGDFGPIFRVQRYSCTTQSLPSGSTILSRKRAVSCNGAEQVGQDDSTTFQVVDDSISTITLLNVDSPPSLDSILPSRKIEEEMQTQVNISSTPESEPLCQRKGNAEDGTARLSDIIGDFEVEARSTVAAWEMVSQKILFALHQAYKQKGAIKLFCGHDAYHTGSLDMGEPLSRFCYCDGISIIPPSIQNESGFSLICDMLPTWLNQDRFGLDLDFVQEILEQLPSVEACVTYKTLSDRKDGCGLQTVGSGFLQSERIMGNALGISKGSLHQSGEIEDVERSEPCPPGKQLSLRLPSHLLGDALQVWENVSRFSEVLGLGGPISFQEFESELLGPLFDGYSLDLGCEIPYPGDAAPSGGANVRQTGSLFLGRSNGRLLTKIFGSLLRLLVGELLSKASVYVCPDVGEPKSRRGRKKDLDFLAALKKTKLDILPVNVLTWHETARRYILAVLCMEGVVDSGEIASRESGKVFHCLRGDGGILCGSLTGVAALEGDAVILADANRKIFGSLKNKNEIITLRERELEVDGSHTAQDNEDGIPEWVQIIEPVRKLPTNVGARIRKRVNEALDKNPPEWAKEILIHSISKAVYKGNASGPTKRAVVSVLDRFSSENSGATAEKKEKLKIETNLADLITKQCRVVLRRAAAADEDKVFCNLLGRIALSPKANYDEGLLGFPAMVSHPLDFRTIDLKLAAGAYGGSHEAFVDDVREVWRNIRTAYGDRANLIDLAEDLSHKFEDLYVKELLSLVEKVSEIKSAEESSADAAKEREELLANISKNPLPKAPWEGLCKVCGMDKDDDNVLLCDKCDSEYHRYCLNPPLLRIPEGNWYCPSCVLGGSTSHSWPHGSVANQIRKSGHQGRFMLSFLDGLGQLINLLEIKDFWEFSLEQRMFFLKFLFDEALNTATVRDHMEKCDARAGELQQKIRFLANEFRILKSKEEFMGLRKEDVPCSSEQIDGRVIPYRISSSGEQSTSAADKNEVTIACQLQGDDEGNTCARSYLPVSGAFSSQESRLEIRNDISNLQKLIASTELELLSVSLRKELLGRDSNGRAYWLFCSPGARPWIVANGSLSPKARRVEEFETIPSSDQWMTYESDGDIEKLVKWLNESTEEKELRDSIMNLQFKLSNDYSECHVLSKVISDHSRPSFEKPSSSDLLATKAVASLQGKLGPCLGMQASGSMHRCECLELFWPSKEHCFTCHHSFLTKEELRHHKNDNCKEAVSASCRSQTNEAIRKATEDTSKRKKLKIIASQDKHSGANTGALQIPGSSAGGSSREPECPFKLEEIISRFIIPNSVQDAVNEVGFIGRGSVPPVVPSRPSYLPQISSHSNKLSTKSTENSLAKEGRTINRVKSSSSVKEKSLLLGLSKSSIVPGSSLRPLVGRACDVLRLLKINLLDMDCALPQEALRTSRMNEDRRRAWRAHVKSARSLYEMVQAVIVLEDAIKSEHLKTDWWYWSSPSTAAKISTLSALALRIYALDSAISYDQPYAANANMETNSMLDEGDTRSQKTPEPDLIETPRTRTRASKRRRE